MKCILDCLTKMKICQHSMRGSLVLILACFCFEVCSAIDHFTISQPVRDSETIVSSGQTYKLGFFSPANSSSRYVGIMFNLPLETVVWVANRDKPINDSAGIMTISADGNLVVLNGQKDILWSSNISNSMANATAQLLDTGNLVLTDNSSGRILWQSFQIPTDSFLNRMRLSTLTNGRKIQLTSWRSPSDPSIGSFSAGIEPEPTPQFIIWNGNRSYWRSGPWNGNSFLGIPGMNTVYQNGFDVVDDNTGQVNITLNYLSTLSFYYELSSSGILQEKVFLNGNWSVTWSTQTSQCDSYGKCGPFGICNPHDSPICTCLEGFEPRDKKEWDGGNWTSGCTRKAMLQCERNNSVGNKGKQDGYLKLKNIKLPDLTEWIATSEDQCGDGCLQNCSCIAYAYATGVGCMHWSGSLIDIQQFSTADGADLYIRVAYSELGDKKKDMKAVIATIIIVGSLFIAFCAYFCWKWLARQKGKKKEDQLPIFEGGDSCKVENIVSHNMDQAKLEELPLFSYKTLANATDNFQPKNQLGKGGFGPVYKGKLPDGREIAVKKLSKSSGQGIEEFMNEIVVISRLQHRNLVRLLGCCIEREETVLVYEYMPNKSLDGYLFESSKLGILDWKRRVTIIEGIARGLLYLHRDSRLKIIHRDLKASNILLDKEMNPKISDFGLARIFGGNQDQAATNRVVGTYGYMAPEYAMEGRFSEKLDVYSFGVLLLEILSGRKNTSFYHDKHELSLVGYVWKLWNEFEIVNLIDPCIYDPCIIMEVWRYVHVGLLCVQENAKDRPNVSTVLSMLNSETADLPRPNSPAYIGKGGSDSKSIQQSQHSLNNVSITDVEGR